MQENGDGSIAQLAGRVTELEHALALLARRLKETWGPRLLAVEQDVDAQRELLGADLVPRLTAVEHELATLRELLTARQEGGE